MTAWAIHDPVERLLQEIPVALPAWIPLALGAALIALVVIRYRLRGGPSDPAAETRAEPAADPRAEALAALESLAEKMPAGQAEEDAFHVAVSYILRRYLSAAFGLGALEMASEEVVRSCGRASGGGTSVAILEDVLDRCDRVKYGARFGGAAAARGTLYEARRFVAAVGPASEQAGSPADVSRGGAP